MRVQLAFAFLVTALLGRVEAATRYVPTTTYPTIQSAINAAVSGDTINVAAGNYYESLLIGKSVTIQRLPYVTGDVNIVGGSSGILVRVSTLNTQITMRNVKLWYGSPTIYGYLSLSPLPPFTALPRLSLMNVYIGLSGTNGGIVGNMHLYADELTVSGSRGRGIGISGTANLIDTDVLNSAGQGIAVYNDFYSPYGWANRLIRGRLEGNGDSGLWVTHSVGTPFVVQDSVITGNMRAGVYFDHSNGGCVQDSTIEHTQEYNGLEGYAVGGYGSTFCVEGSLIGYNSFGVSVQTASDGVPSQASLTDVALLGNDIQLAAFGCDSGMTDLGGNWCSDEGGLEACVLLRYPNCGAPMQQSTGSGGVPMASTPGTGAGMMPAP